MSPRSPQPQSLEDVWVRLRALALKQALYLPLSSPAAPAAKATGQLFIAPLAAVSLDRKTWSWFEERFRRISLGSNTSASNTHAVKGAGLSIARSLIEKSLVEKTFLEKASRNLVTASALPAEQPTRAQEGLHMNPAIKLLIAEDNEENLFLYRAYLSGHSVLIDTASTGVEAVRKCAENQYDLLIMDVEMPLMDGLAATREIRQRERQRGVSAIPIIALTSHSLVDAAGRCQQAGCDTCLSKPISKVQLLDAITAFAPPRPAEPVIDPAIAALQPRYLNNRRNDLDRMQKALQTGEFDVIRKLAHDWKGTGAGYGFPEISAIGRELEQAAIRRDPSSVATGLGQMEDRVGRLLTT